ncbi:hypothetical protein IFR05_009430 [Cadophora sp. M221]|nr:hypothetical protein IFR05_009430 [Cadophora sp. M221]
MKLITSLLIIAFLALEVLAATISHLGGSYNGLPLLLEPMEFNITIDGKPVRGQGTIQYIYAQYASENPSFKIPDNLSLSSALQLKAANSQAQKNVEKRAQAGSCLESSFSFPYPISDSMD